MKIARSYQPRSLATFAATSFSRKVSSHRANLQENASAEQLNDLEADLSQIVQEEADKSRLK